MPMEREIKKLWTQKISQHQEIDSNIVYFQVCERHFTDDGFVRKNGKLALKKEAIPSVFDEAPDSVVGSESASVSENRTYKAMEPRRFCEIKHCPNEVGTNDKEISFFR